MDGKQTQIYFAPNVEAIEELGANWYNIVRDISDYLQSQGFQYSRTLGFVNDRELSEEELAQVFGEIVKLAWGKENLLYARANIISDVQDLTWMLKRKDGEE
ncbi:MAG: hypothetical protein NC079_03850 [Clostridium sp.]|nr:hypothetical protein [Acetatifactor muris]MCM1526125.1 hypothetical protein [Bacteroides sp.]MCM1562727.1 hypothetical protein [Clostridium sp.]